MPQIGSIGQRRLLNSKVLIIGAGGLGSPVSIYLSTCWHRKDWDNRHGYSRNFKPPKANTSH
ncbi:MAG: ThiF family adenylyltransferase [Dehalococcoidia bacterium]